MSFANPTSPPQDAHFSHLTVATNTTRGAPPRDALFSNVTVNTNDYSFGNTIHDLNVSKLAVTGLIQGTVDGNGAIVIGRV